MCPTWDNCMYDELCQIAQRNKTNKIKGINTVYFVHPNTIPNNRKVTYIRIVMDIQPQKAVPEHVKLTISDDKVKYTGEVTTCTADLITVKLIQ